MKKSDSKLQLGLALSSHAVTDLYASFILGLIPVLTIKFNLSIFLVSLLTSISGISNSLTQPVFGFLSDKYGYRYFIIAGPLFSAIFISLLGVTPNYVLLLIFLFMGNLAIAALHPSNAAMGGHCGGRRKGLANSLISFAGTLGYSLGSLFIILIIENIGLEFTPVAMIPGLIMALILIKYLPRSTVQKENKGNKAFFRSLFKVKKIKIILLIIIIFVSFGRDLLWLTLVTFMPLYFTAAGIELTNIGYIFLLFGLVGASGGLIAGYYWDKLRRKIPIIQVSLLLGIPFVFFIYKTDGIVSIIMFIISGFFFIATLPLCIRLAQDIFPTKLSIASALVMGLAQGLSALTMIFLGKLADDVGMQMTTYWVLLLIIAGIIMLSVFQFLYNKAFRSGTLVGGEGGI
jgi:MFS transporter, FSR family, fosmidomycin resistance protein